MANALVALQGQSPQINAMQAFGQGQQQAAQIDMAKKQSASQALQIIGAAAMAAQQDPSQFDQILTDIEGMGVKEAAMFRGKPEMIPVLAKASMTALQQVGSAQDNARLELALKQFDQSVLEANRAFDMRKQELGLSQQRLTFDQQRAQMPGAPSGYRVSPDGNLQAIPGGPADPANPINTKRVRDVTLSPTDKKAIFEAEDEIPQLDNTIATLSRALELNDKTSEGMGAYQVGQYGTYLPDAIEPSAAAPTREYSDIMTQEAATAMSAALKGATTDRELAIFTNIIADVSKPKEVRKRALERMKQLAERKRSILSDRVEQLKSGTYYDAPGGDAQSGTSEITTKEQYDALPSGAEFVWQGQRGRKP